MMRKDLMNKDGDTRGTKEVNKQNFANSPETQEKAQASRKSGNAKAKEAATQAVKKSSAIAQGRSKRITPEVQQYVRDELTSTDKSGNTFLLNYIKAFLTEAKKDPNSNCGRMLASAIFNDKLFSTLDEEANRQMNQDSDFKIYQIRQTLYDRQQEVYDDVIDNNYLIINSRRTGKTELAGRIIVRDLVRPIFLPNGMQAVNRVAYINRSSSAAIRQIKQPLLTALNKVGLRCIQGSVESQEMHFENGSTLLIIGNNNAADIDKLRGEKFNTVIMDECAHQRNTRQIMREVIGPCLKDYGKERRLYLIGTPPRIPHTYIEDIYNKAVELGWKLFHWTFMDNPFMPDREHVIEDVCKENGVTPDSSFIRREYFGEMNVFDTDAKYIKHYTELNEAQAKALKQRTWDYCWIGVDWGYEDNAAIVVAVADKRAKEMYVVYDWSEPHKGNQYTCEKVKEIYDNVKKEYNLAREPWVIADTNEKGNIADLYRIHKITHACCAYKYDKDAALDQLADFIHSNKIKICPDAKAVKNDADLMLWKRDEESDKILHELDDDTYHGNAMFALLYVNRQFAVDVMGSTTAKTAKEIIEEC